MYAITNEQPADAGEIETLLDQVFGADRGRRTVYRLREGVAPVDEMCFVLRHHDDLVASIRFWPVEVAGNVPALLLGPIAVRPDRHGRGYGAALMNHALDAARNLGHGVVLLVGDADYYARFGFTRVAAAALSLPGPVDEARFLAMELQPNALGGVAGMVGKARCLRAA